jgi:spermidine/putrescine transport system permease protein
MTQATTAVDGAATGVPPEPSEAPNQHGGKGLSNISRFGMLAPSTAWLLLFVLAPISILFLYSFWSSENYVIIQKFTLANYRDTFSDPVFRTVMWRTLRLAFLVTATSLLLGYPVAYFIARKVTRWKTFFYLLVIIPMWSSYLVRVYSWKTVLGEQGAVNLLLMKIGILQEPSPIFLYNVFAVYLALVGSILPFMILPIYTSLEKIPKSLIEASSDLGAGFWRTLAQVIFPLSLPGTLAGCTFTFVLVLGDFIASQLLGGTSGILIGKVIYGYFGLAFDWPMGSAMSFVLFAIVFALIAVAARFGALREG